MDPEGHSEEAIVQRVISPNDVPVVRVWEIGLLILVHRATGLLFSCLPWTRNGWDDGDRFSRVGSCYVLSRIVLFIANRSQELICLSYRKNPGIVPLNFVVNCRGKIGVGQSGASEKKNLPLFFFQYNFSF